MKKEKILNIPNALSFYRLAVFPLVFFFAFSGNEKYFAIFLCLNLATDVLDGFIARTFNMVTKLGAALDNLADFGTYLLAVYGIYRFKWHFIKEHSNLLIIFFIVLLVTVLIALIKFRKMPGLHLYSCVLAGYLQGAFFFLLFAWGFQLWLYYLCLTWGLVAYCEKTLVLFIIEEIRPGIKGVYWLLKEKRKLRRSA